MNNKIIAVDFDGTLCENKWPEIGAPNMELISYLREQQAEGARIILWTNRCGDALKAAVYWCDDRGLLFNAVNDNLPEIIEEFGSNCRKIFANEYIDDRMNKQFNLPFTNEQKPVTPSEYKGIRCRNCKYYQSRYGYQSCYRTFNMTQMHADDFCSYWEPK